MTADNPRRSWAREARLADIAEAEQRGRVKELRDLAQECASAAVVEPSTDPRDDLMWRAAWLARRADRIESGDVTP